MSNNPDDQQSQMGEKEGPQNLTILNEEHLSDVNNSPDIPDTNKLSDADR